MRRRRQEVLELRASKGMVLDEADRDTHSCGSFFTNPIVSAQFARTLPLDAPAWPMDDDAERVKLSAAWLIEQSGVKKGLQLGESKAGISTKHALAITNRGGASAKEVAELARFVQERVAATFGINLIPEPSFIGF
jgi:UDP-N-acetylmuramate dehydrogenase